MKNHISWEEADWFKQISPNALGRKGIGESEHGRFETKSLTRKTWIRGQRVRAWDVEEEDWKYNEDAWREGWRTF